MQTTLREGALPAPDPGENRVLYIDDDAALQHAFARSLSAHGVRVDAVAKQAEALSLAARFPYPVIVTELRRPDIDGWALIPELRSLQPEASVVVTTADSDELLESNALLETVACLLRKPWDERELTEIVTTACARHRQRRAHYQSNLEDRWSVLLVEGDRAAAARVTEQLQLCGASGDVAHCSCLSSALALLQAQTFDVVMVALDLPDAMGLDALCQLQHAAPEAALLALRAGMDPDERASALQLGAHDCLAKGGLEPATLRGQLQRAVASKRAERV